jgi:hypothetical protein
MQNIIHHLPIYQRHKHLRIYLAENNWLSSHKHKRVPLVEAVKVFGVLIVAMAASLANWLFQC